MESPTFTRVSSLETFFGPPARRITVHRAFAYWQMEREVFGSIVWGRPDESDVAQMCAAHEVGANPLFRGHASLIDVRALESVDLLAFQRLLAYLVKRRDAWSPNVSRQVILHGGGYAHAVVLGMFRIFGPTHAIVFEDDPAKAFATVGASAVRAELESMRLELLGTPEIVRRLEAVLAELGPRATVSAIARRLGTSARSLQRRLAAVGTTLGVEQQKHVVRSCERLLEHTELDLDAIAAQVGASSASHLVTLCRRHRGRTPGELRAALRHAVRDAAG